MGMKIMASDINQKEPESLSKKIHKSKDWFDWITVVDVREAVGILKERQCVCIDNKELGINAKCRLCKDIEEIFGDKLI